MKKIIILLLFVLQLLSCSNKKYKEEAFETKSVDKELMIDKPVGFSTDKLIKQKLTDYFELIKLKQKHPEFKDDIILQLKSKLKYSSKPNIEVTYDSIENIREVTSENISDSIKKVKLYYDVLLEDTRYTDSIAAYLVSKSIIIAGDKKITTKITFSHY